MKLFIVFLTLLTIICLAGLTSATSAVTIQNNKYENIVIAISPFVPEDPALINKIKVFLHLILPIYTLGVKSWRTSVSLLTANLLSREMGEAKLCLKYDKMLVYAFTILRPV